MTVRPARALGRISILLSVWIEHVFEPQPLLVEVQVHVAGTAIAILEHHQLGRALDASAGVVHLLAVNAEHDVCVLLDGAERAEVTATFEPWGALLGRLQLQEVTVVQPRVSLRRLADGSDNWGDIVDRMRAKGKGGAPIKRTTQSTANKKPCWVRKASRTQRLNRLRSTARGR